VDWENTSKAQFFITLILGASLFLFLAFNFIKFVEPASANISENACRTLSPSMENPMFPKMPVAAPDISAIDKNGKKVSLRQFRGKVVLLNFWATWCDVCKLEKPRLEELQETIGSDLVILSLASESDTTKVFQKYNASPLQILVDKPKPNDDSNLGKDARRFGVNKVPESFIIDKSGNLRYYFVNKRDWNPKVVQSCIEPLLH